MTDRQHSCTGGACECQRFECSQRLLRVSEAGGLLNACRVLKRHRDETGSLNVYDTTEHAPANAIRVPLMAGPKRTAVAFARLTQS